MVDPAERYRKLRDTIPDEVELVVAAKERSPQEIRQVIEAGAQYVGENYTYPEAVRKYNELEEIRDRVRWELIGHLQKNDINKALPIFDRVQTVESLSKAEHIDKRVERTDKEVMPVLIEVNSGREESKHGIEPTEEALARLIEGINELSSLRLEGLMTMGPFTGDPEDARPYFSVTRKLFDAGKDYVQGNSKMEVLSMGMSNSYQVAIEEGANMVRLGTKIFGPR